MRRQRVYQFVVVLVLIFPSKIFSQQLSPRNAQFSPHALQISYAPQTNWSIGLNSAVVPKRCLESRTRAIFSTMDEGQRSDAGAVQEFINPSYFLSCLGFFCKKELQFERRTAIPLRLRLGSLEYVNRMEGKK